MENGLSYVGGENDSILPLACKIVDVAQDAVLSFHQHLPCHLSARLLYYVQSASI
jgi:hypothetical protein